MFAAFLLSFRETLEASFIVGIVLVSLPSHSTVIRRQVIAGIVAGSVVSMLFFLLLHAFVPSLPPASPVLSGILPLSAATLLTMFLWLSAQNSDAIGHARAQTKMASTTGTGWALGLFCFLAVLREGTELVAMLETALPSNMWADLPAIGAGILTAVAIALGLLRRTSRAILGHLFWVTTLLMALFASTLLAEALNAFAETGAGTGTPAGYWGGDLGMNGQVFARLLVALFGEDGHLPTVIAICASLYFIVLSLFIEHTRHTKLPAGNNRPGAERDRSTHL